MSDELGQLNDTAGVILHVQETKALGYRGCEGGSHVQKMDFRWREAGVHAWTG